MRWLIVLALWLLPSIAATQTTVRPCVTTGSGPAGCPPVSSSNPLPVTVENSGSGAITPKAASGSLTLATGGAAQTLFAAGEVVAGCVIGNPTTATEEGIGAAEAISVSLITTAVAGGGVATTILEAGQWMGCGAGLTTAVSWIAATTGHKINAYVW